MSNSKKPDILFIKDENSEFDSDTTAFNIFFNKVDKAIKEQEVLKYIEENKYDVILADLSIEPEGAKFLKELKDKNKQQTIFALVSPKDTDKLYAISDSGVNAFELLPSQFDQALEAISQFDPNEK